MSPTPNLSAVFARIDQQQDAFIERLIDYVRRPSISAHGLGIAEVGQFLVEQLTALGLDTELVPTAGWPVVVGRRADHPSGLTVMLYGHYDVQPPDPLDQWVSPPFEPTIRNGRLYARGVGDNKGQVDGMVNGEGGQIALNAKFLAEAISAIKTSQIALETQTAQNPAVFRPVGADGYIHIVMPMTVR